MAKVVNNIFVRGLSGQVGGQFVIRRLKDGRTIVCKSPDFSHRKLSEAQKEHHRRVKQASAYAKPASQSNPIYGRLAEGTMKNAYNVAMGDWFNPPVIHKLGRYGAAVRIWATDDVQADLFLGHLSRLGCWWIMLGKLKSTIGASVSASRLYPMLAVGMRRYMHRGRRAQQLVD